MKTGMSVDDALTAMDALERQRSRIGDAATDALMAVLLRNPSAFWQTFFEVMNPPSTQAVKLLVQLGPDATLADLKAALESDGRS
jgi:hypothetical protein